MHQFSTHHSLASPCLPLSLCVRVDSQLLLLVEAPSTVSWLLGCAVMCVGVVVPIGYMLYKNKMPSSNSAMHYQ